MTTAEDDIIRRDPALPGLAMLLQPEALAAALRRALPGVPIGPAQLRYIRYKRGTNCLVSCRLTVGETPLEIHAKAFAPKSRDKFEKARDAIAVGGPLGPGSIAFESELVVVTAFPNDRKITGLLRYADPESRARLLRKLLPSRPDLWDGEVETLVYKPDRRLVARLSTDGVPRAALKLYTEGEFAGAATSAQTLQPRGALRFAPLIGQSDRRHILAFEWISGRVLNEELPQSSLRLSELAEVGAAVAALHAQNAAGLPVLTRETEIEHLREAARDIAWVVPSLAARADSLAETLAKELASEPPVGAPIHGDFHARQIVLNEHVTILDVDRAWCGDPMLDLGLFRAHLERDVIRGGLTRDRVEPISGALHEGYGRATGAPIPARADFYSALELFRLAPRFFRYAESDWPQKMEAALDRVAAILSNRKGRG